MVRVAGLHDQIDAGIEKPLQDGRTPTRDDRRDPPRAARAASRASRRCWTASCGRSWPSTGSGSSATPTSTREDRRELDERFRRQIFPVLTPLAVGLGRPFPYISNLSLSLGVIVRDPQTDVQTFARVKVPKEMLPRFVPVGDGQHVRAARGPDRREPRHAVPGHGDPRPRTSSGSPATPTSRCPTRPTTCCRRSRTSCAAGASARSCASRSAPGMSAAMREQITRALEVDTDDVFEIDGLLDLKDLWDIVKVPGHARAARRAVDAGHPAAPAARRGRAARRPGRDAQARHPAPPPVRLVRRPRSSASSSRRSTTRTCSRSSRPCTGRATTRRWCRR